jgi:hypothetical protein
MVRFRVLTVDLEVVLADVMTGAFQSRGALDVIGDIYFRAQVAPELGDLNSRRVLALLSQFLNASLPLEVIAKGALL